MSVPGRFRATILGLALATLLPAHATGNTLLTTATHGVVCTSDLSHPVDVQVVALDPIRRGATVRFAVRSTSSCRSPTKRSFSREVGASGRVRRIRIGVTGDGSRIKRSPRT